MNDKRKLFKHDNKFKKRIAKAKGDMNFKDERKNECLKSIMKSLNEFENVAIVGPNGVGKSTIVNTALKYSALPKNIWNTFCLFWLFILYLPTKFLSKKWGFLWKEQILKRRQKTIKINLWQLFSLRNKEDYPKDVPSGMWTAGHKDSCNNKCMKTDCQVNKKTYSRHLIIKDENQHDRKQVTHLHIKRTLWSAITNALKPRFKRVNLEKVLKKEIYEEGGTTRRIIPVVIFLIFACLLILIGVPFGVYFALEGKINNEASKVALSIGVDIPLSIVMIFFKKWMSTSRERRINDLLADQSNNLFIAKTLDSKAKMKVINIHFEDLDRFYGWIGEERFEVVKSILNNIKLIYNVENIRILIEMNKEIWSRVGDSNDLKWKISQGYSPVPTINAQSLNDEILTEEFYKQVQMAYEDQPTKLIIRNVSSKVVKKFLLWNESEKNEDSWRYIKNILPNIRCFILEYFPFLEKDNFFQVSNAFYILFKEIKEKHFEEIKIPSNLEEQTGFHDFKIQQLREIKFIHEKKYETLKWKQFNLIEEKINKWNNQKVFDLKSETTSLAFVADCFGIIFNLLDESLNIQRKRIASFSGQEYLIEQAYFLLDVITSQQHKNFGVFKDIERFLNVFIDDYEFADEVLFDEEFLDLIIICRILSKRKIKLTNLSLKRSCLNFDKIKINQYIYVSGLSLAELLDKHYEVALEKLGDFIEWINYAKKTLNTFSAEGETTENSLIIINQLQTQISKFDNDPEFKNCIKEVKNILQEYGYLIRRRKKNLIKNQMNALSSKELETKEDILLKCIFIYSIKYPLINWGVGYNVEKSKVIDNFYSNIDINNNNIFETLKIIENYFEEPGDKNENEIVKEMRGKISVNDL